MIAEIPNWLNIVFILCWLYALVLFYFSNGKPNKGLLMLLIWSGVHSVLAYIGFYNNTTAFPPRIALVLIPVFLTITYVAIKKQTWIIEHRNIKVSTFLHAVRIPVEIVLYYLFTFKAIPELMTFEGWNFDILAGITALLIGVLLLTNKINHQWLLAWNVVGLVLIFTILTIGALSAELPFQQFAFEQPNRALIFFPYILLPGVVVPLVIFTHLTDIIFFVKKKKVK